MTSNILIFCAHSDDEAVGMGGTIAKFVDSGKEIVKVVFSFGEKSHPHLKEKVIASARVEESIEASEFLGIKETIFLGLDELKFDEEIKKFNIKEKIIKIIEKYNPERIYTPSEMDLHPMKNHEAVYRLINAILGKMQKKYPLYAFEVWDVSKANKPYVYEDISKYYKKKIAYMKSFSSQWLSMYGLMPSVFLRAKKYGRAIGVKYAERFYKIR